MAITIHPKSFMAPYVTSHLTPHTTVVTDMVCPRSTVSPLMAHLC